MKGYGIYRRTAMFEEKTTFAEKMIELRNKKSQEQVPKNEENDINNGIVIINQKIYEIEEMELADGKIFMNFPSEFVQLNEKLAESKYPYIIRPQYIYSDESTSVNITFTIDDKTVESEEIEELKEYLIGLLTNLHPEYEIIDEEVIQEDDLTIAMFGFTKTTLDGEIYQIIFLRKLNKRLLIGGFSCNAEVKDEWYPVIYQMIQTIRPMNKDRNSGE